MKKVLIIINIFMICFCLTGCSNNATMAVENYLNKYTSLDEQVINDMSNIIQMEDLNDDQKTIYQSIFERQYTDLTYEIENEEYYGDEAIITVNVEVYDYYKAQNEAIQYLANNPDEFNDEKGIYDKDLYITYKLNKLKDFKERTTYSIDFYALNTKDGWTISKLSNSDLEKIHGIYNYES